MRICSICVAACQLVHHRNKNCAFSNTSLSLVLQETASIEELAQQAMAKRESKDANKDTQQEFSKLIKLLNELKEKEEDEIFGDSNNLEIPQIATDKDVLEPSISKSNYNSYVEGLSALEQDAAVGLQQTESKESGKSGGKMFQTNDDEKEFQNSAAASGLSTRGRALTLTNENARNIFDVNLDTAAIKRVESSEISDKYELDEDEKLALELPKKATEQTNEDRSNKSAAFYHDEGQYSKPLQQARSEEILAEDLDQMLPEKLEVNSTTSYYTNDDLSSKKNSIISNIMESSLNRRTNGLPGLLGLLNNQNSMPSKENFYTESESFANIPEAPFDSNNVIRNRQNNDFLNLDSSFLRIFGNSQEEPQPDAIADINLSLNEGHGNQLVDDINSLILGRGGNVGDTNTIQSIQSIPNWIDGVLPLSEDTQSANSWLLESLGGNQIATDEEGKASKVTNLETDSPFLQNSYSDFMDARNEILSPNLQSSLNVPDFNIPNFDTLDSANVLSNGFGRNDLLSSLLVVPNNPVENFNLPLTELLSNNDLLGGRNLKKNRKSASSDELSPNSASNNQPGPIFASGRQPGPYFASSNQPDPNSVKDLDYFNFLLVDSPRNYRHESIQNRENGRNYKQSQFYPDSNFPNENSYQNAFQNVLEQSYLHSNTIQQNFSNDFGTTFVNLTGAKPKETQKKKAKNDNNPTFSDNANAPTLEELNQFSSTNNQQLSSPNRLQNFPSAVGFGRPSALPPNSSAQNHTSVFPNFEESDVEDIGFEDDYFDSAFSDDSDSFNSRISNTPPEVSEQNFGPLMQRNVFDSTNSPRSDNSFPHSRFGRNNNMNFQTIPFRNQARSNQNQFSRQNFSPFGRRNNENRFDRSSLFSNRNLAPPNWRRGWFPASFPSRSFPPSRPPPFANSPRLYNEPGLTPLYRRYRGFQKSDAWPNEKSNQTLNTFFNPNRRTFEEIQFPFPNYNQPYPDESNKNNDDYYLRPEEPQSDRPTWLFWRLSFLLNSVDTGGSGATDTNSYFQNRLPSLWSRNQASEESSSKSFATTERNKVENDVIAVDGEGEMQNAENNASKQNTKEETTNETNAISTFDTDLTESNTDFSNSLKQASKDVFHEINNASKIYSYINKFLIAGAIGLSFTILVVIFLVILSIRKRKSKKIMVPVSKPLPYKTMDDGEKSNSSSVNLHHLPEKGSINAYFIDV